MCVIGTADIEHKMILNWIVFLFAVHFSMALDSMDELALKAMFTGFSKAACTLLTAQLILSFCRLL